MWRLLVVSMALSEGLAGGGAHGQRPNFTGDWVLNRARTQLQYPAAVDVDSAVVRIAHRDSLFRFFRRFVVRGRADTLSWELSPDAPEVGEREGARQSFSRLYWVADTLVFVSRIVAPQGQAVDTVWYRLLEGSRLLEARERFRAPRLQYDNTWVFDRRASGGSEPRRATPPNHGLELSPRPVGDWCGALQGWIPEWPQCGRPRRSSSRSR